MTVLRVPLLCLLALGGCVNRTASRATTGTAVGMLACDWSQTRSIAEGGWRSHEETNPVLGTNPSPHVIDAYMGATAVVLVAASELLSPRYAFAISAVAIGVETKAIGRNVMNRADLCH